MADYTWLPNGDDISEYCGYDYDLCGKCPVRNTCSERERIEAELEEREINGEDEDKPE